MLSAIMGSTHIFLHVVRREKDFFSGVKSMLHQYEEIEVVDIELSKELYDRIDEAEYSRSFVSKSTSELKLFKRVLTYLPIFKSLEEQIRFAVKKRPDNRVFLYLADEGVWAEVLKLIQKKLNATHKNEIKIINIQHGFFTLEKIYFKKRRCFFNYLSCKIIGYPILGFGFGGSGLETYFVYGEGEKTFIADVSPGSEVIVSPYICKHELITRVKKIGLKKEAERTLLFAAQLNEINPDILFSEEEITIKLRPLFKILHEEGYHVNYRLHPAIRDTNKYLGLLKKYDLLDYVSISDSSLEEDLAGCCGVISLQSTTMYDGYVVGKTPIVIKGLTRTYEFTTPHESLDINSNIEEQVARIIKVLQVEPLEEVSLEAERNTLDFFKRIIEKNEN